MAHAALALSPSGVPAPASAAAKTFLPTSDVERPPLLSIGNSAPTGAWGFGGGGAKRFLKAALRFHTMFMYRKGEPGTYEASTVLSSATTAQCCLRNAGSDSAEIMVPSSPEMPVG